MLSVFTSILPVFLVMFVGYMTGKKSIFDEFALKKFNKFTYWIAMPALIFISMVKSSWQRDGIFNLIIAITFSVIILFIVIFAIGRFVFNKPVGQLAIDSHIASFPNTAYAGIPIVIAVLPPNYMLPAIIAVIVFNIVSTNMAVLILEIKKSKDGNTEKALWHVLKSVITNPITYPTIIGGVFSYYDWQLPIFFTKFCELLAAPAAPLGLFVVGLSLALHKIKLSILRQIALPVLLKLLAQPLIVALFLLVLFPTDPVWAWSAILMASLPTGVTSFVLAEHYGINPIKASSAIFITTALSVISLVFVISWIQV